MIILLCFSNDKLLCDVVGSVSINNQISNYALEDTLLECRDDLNKFNFNGNDLNVNFTNSSIQIQNKTDENLRVVDVGQLYNNNGYLLVDISGQRVDISGQTVKCDISGQTVNVSNAFNLESTQQQIKTDLDKMTYLNNKLLCDVSGQRIDVSGETVNIGSMPNVNVSNAFNLIKSPVISFSSLFLFMFI